MRAPLHFSNQLGWKAFTGTIFALAVLLSGCAGGSWWPFGQRSGEEIRPTYPDATAYACDSGKRLLVQYGPANKYAMIIFPDREFRLDAEASGEGTRFSNGRTALLLANGEARLEEAGTTTFANCKNEPGNK